MEGGETRQPLILWWNMGDLAERFGFPAGQVSPELKSGVVTDSFSCICGCICGWSACPHCADVKCKSHCSVGAGWPTYTLSYMDTWESVHFHDSKSQHCRHSCEQDTSENLAVPPSSQRALQGAGLLSSHTESITFLFTLFSDSTVCSALPSFSLSRLCFCPLLWWSPGLEALWNKYTVAKCTDIGTGSCDCTQNSEIKQIPNNDTKATLGFWSWSDVFGTNFIHSITSGPLNPICCTSWGFLLSTTWLEDRSFI